MTNSRSYGTLTPTATPQRYRSSPSTPTYVNGMAAGSVLGEDDDTVLMGEGEFSDEVDDRTPWMRRGKQGKATVGSSITNLANTIIGSGALAFPSVFASMGLAPAFASCLFAGACSAFGLYLLSLCARQVGRPASQPATAFSSSGPNTPVKGFGTPRSGLNSNMDSGIQRSALSQNHLKAVNPGHEKPEASFNQVALLTFGQGWATRCFDAAIAIKCFGVSVSYLIIVKTLMPQVILSISHHLPSETLPEDSRWLDGRLWLLLSFGIIGPLSFLRRMDSLRFTSQIALASVVYLVIIVVGWYAFGVPTGKPRGEVVWARFSTGTLGVFPVQIFAYTCAQNLFAVFNELKFNTQKRMNQVVAVSIGSAALTYEVLGIIGYLTFGRGVGSNVIAMYPWTSMIIAIGRLGIVLLVALSYPLQCHPCRGCLHTLSSGWSKETHDPLNTEPTPESEDDEEDEDDMYDAEDSHGMPVGKPMGKRKFIGLTVGIIVAGLAIAMVIDELEVVLSFVGSTGSTMISFILPGLFYFSLFRHEGGPIKWLALSLAIYGVAVMIFWFWRRRNIITTALHILQSIFVLKFTKMEHAFTIVPSSGLPFQVKRSALLMSPVFQDMFFTTAGPHQQAEIRLTDSEQALRCFFGLISGDNKPVGSMNLCTLPQMLAAAPLFDKYGLPHLLTLCKVPALNWASQYPIQCLRLATIVGDQQWAALCVRYLTSATLFGVCQCGQPACYCHTHCRKFDGLSAWTALGPDLTYSIMAAIARSDMWETPVGIWNWHRIATYFELPPKPSQIDQKPGLFQS